MRYLLPRPFPDELLGSWWIRTVRMLCLPVRTLAREIVGRKFAPGFLQVAGVAEVAAMLGVEPLDLLREHTVFPYATAYVEPTVLANALQAALSLGVDARGMGAVTQSVSDLVGYRRFCTRCAREEFKRWGESYWHRAHHLPGVLYCHRHEIGLHETSLRSVGLRSWTEDLPHEVKGKRIPNRPGTEFDLALMQKSVPLLDRPRAEQLNFPPQWYREQLVRLGLNSANQQIGTDKLKAWLGSAMKSEPTSFGLSAKDADLHWTGLFFRPRTAHPFIPLKHLLVQTAFDLQAPSSEPILDHVVKGPSAAPRDQLDRKFAAAARKVVAEYIRRGERVRVEDALAEAGCWCLFRHDARSFPRLQQVVRDLKASPAAMRPNWGKGLKRRRSSRDFLST